MAVKRLAKFLFNFLQSSVTNIDTIYIVYINIYIDKYYIYILYINEIDEGLNITLDSAKTVILNLFDMCCC